MIRDVTLREMIEAMAALPDDAVFRWFQTSRPDPEITAEAGELLRVTMGQVRRELGLA